MTISKSVSSSIASALVRHRFVAEVDAIREAEAVLAMDVYHSHWSEHDLAKMAMVPREWLATTSSVEIAGGWGYVTLWFGGTRYFKHFQSRAKAHAMLWPMADRCHATRVTVPNAALAARVEAHAKAIDDLAGAITAAHADAARTIGGMTTVKKLVDAWPEIAPFAVPYLVAKAALPAIRTEELNARFGLPVDEAAA